MAADGARRAGRGAPMVLGFLALGLALAAFALWRLSARPERGTDAPTPAPVQAPAAPAATPAPLTAARTPAVSVEAPADTATRARLVVRLVVPPGGLPDGPIRVTLTRADGREEPAFELTRAMPRRELELAPGELTVSAASLGPPALASAPTLTNARAGTTAQVELELRASVRFRGLVRDELGSAQEDVRVALLRNGRLQASAKSDAAGRFALAPLAAGEYELVLGDPRGPLLPRATLVLAAGDTPREIVLPTPVPLTVRIVDADGRTVEGASIDGTGTPGGSLSGLSDADGLLRVERLPPGEYRVFARHAEKGRGNRALALDADSSASVFEVVLYR